MDERDYRERLAQDLVTWERSGLINDRQRSEILAHSGFGEPRLVGALRLGWFATAVSIVGATVLAGGIGLFLATNWELMPIWSRTVLVFVAMLAAYALGYSFMYRLEMQRIGSALILLGALLYEAGLFIVADSYGMGADSPVLMLLASVGILPLAYLFGSRIILLLAIGNVIAWVVADLSSRYPDSPKSQAAMLVVAVLGVTLYAVGCLHRLRREIDRFADVYLFSGLLVLLAIVFVNTFTQNWDEMIEAGVEPFAAPAVVYVAVAIAAAVVGLEALSRERDRESLLDLTAQAAVLGLAVVVATWPGWRGYAFVFDGVYFAIAAGLVTRGYLHGDGRYVNFGLAALALGLLTRYVDLFWSEVADSLFFVVGGLLLLAVAFVLERLRRRLLSDMKVAGSRRNGSASNDPGVRGLPA